MTIAARVYAWQGVSVLSAHRMPLALSLVVMTALAFPVHSFAQESDADGRSVPLGYREMHSAQGVMMWRKGREYVQIVTPARGGRIKLMTGEIKPSMYPGTTFERKDIRHWWTQWKEEDPSAVSIMNGQFFNMNDPAKAPLAFSTKVDGVIHPGYGDGVEYPQGKLVLLLGDTRYDIAAYGDDAAVLFEHQEHEALVGLKPDMSKRATKRTGRTFIGVTPDGGSAIVLTTPGGTQRYATRILIAFGADRGKILMLDGGGSSQLVTEQGLLVPTKRGELRTIPQAIGVSSGN